MRLVMGRKRRRHIRAGSALLVFGGFGLALAPGVGASPQPGAGAPPSRSGQTSEEPASEETPVEAGAAAAAYPFEVIPDVTLGTEPQSADVTGQRGIPDSEYVPEVFQYRRRGAQRTQATISGDHRSAALTELRVLDREADPGDTVRAIARVERAFEKGRRFVAEFWSQEYGRAAVVYVNFRPHARDKTLYLGRGRIGRHHPGGRYNIGSTMITDEHGRKKAYSNEFNPVMRAPDGSPEWFVVADNPNADLTPPRLGSIRILTPHVGPGGTIRVEARVEDDLAGPMQARTVFAGPSGRRRVRADLIGDSRDPGRFLGAFTIPEWYEGGTWSLEKVELFDAARNSALLFAATDPALRGATVAVTQNPERRDDDAPVLLALELPLRQAAADESVPVAALVEDDLSGVDRVYVSFQSPSGADLIRVRLESANPPLNRPSLVPQPHVFRGSLELEPWHERGTYTVSRVNLSDHARNYRNLNPVRDDEVRNLSVAFDGDESASALGTEADRRQPERQR